MSGTLYACVHATEFPAQALLRLRPDLQGAGVAVLEGRSPGERVCALNRVAQCKGAVRGMTRVEAEEIQGLRLIARSAECEAAARAVMLEGVAQFSPRIEEASEDAACVFVLDIAGTERLFGPPHELAKRLRNALATCGLHASVVVSANYHTARMKAAVVRGIQVIPAGEEARSMENLPVHSLHLAERPAETFALWGIRTLGELADLPGDELIARCGTKAQRWQELARGVASHLFHPLEMPCALKEFCAFDAPVEQVDSLLFVAGRMLDCLITRASGQAMALVSMTVKMRMARGGVYTCVLRPAMPSVDRKFLLKLLQLEMGAHPPQGSGTALEITAEAGRTGKVQLGLFAPPTPEPSQLDVTLARLRTLVGEGRVGSPVLENTHRAASFHVGPFSAVVKESAAATGRQRVTLRRVRPPVSVRVSANATGPVVFRQGEARFEVISAYGPWRSSGSWWTTGGWDADEWDVLAQKKNGAEFACVLVFDRIHRHWRLEAYYD